MEKERLKFCIERFDHYFDSVNNKSNVFIFVSSLLIGVVSSILPMISQYSCGWVIDYILPSLIVFLGILTIIFVLFASIPYLPKNTESLLYFGSLGAMKQREYSKKSIECTKEEELDDYRNQVFQLSVGLLKKYKRLRIAAFLFVGQILLFVPLFISLLINLKSKS